MEIKELIKEFISVLISSKIESRFTNWFPTVTDFKTVPSEEFSKLQRESKIFTVEHDGKNGTLNKAGLQSLYWQKIHIRYILIL